MTAVSEADSLVGYTTFDLAPGELDYRTSFVQRLTSPITAAR